MYSGNIDVVVYRNLLALDYFLNSLGMGNRRGFRICRSLLNHRLLAGFGRFANLSWRNIMDGRPLLLQDIRAETLTHYRVLNMLWSLALHFVLAYDWAEVTLLYSWLGNQVYWAVLRFKHFLMFFAVFMV